MVRSWFASCVAVVSLGTSCEPLPPIDLETDELEIGTDYAFGLCGGDLAYLDRHVRAVERVLDADSDDRVRLYLHEELPEDACSDHAASCYKPREDYIVSTWFYVEHEIVHAVMSRVGKPERFFNEGLAEALSGRRTQFGRTRPSLNLALRAGEQDYPMAGHFMRWLGETYGPEPLRTLVRRSNDQRGRRHALRALRTTYGTSMEDLEEEFYADAPWSYEGSSWCNHPRIEQGEDGRWEQSFTLDCAEESTYSSGRQGVYTIRTFAAPHAGTYSLTLDDHTYALLWRCQSEAMLEPVENAPAVGVGTEPGGRTWWRPLWLRPGTLHELELDPASYRIELFLPDVHEGTVTARFSPKLGVVPVTPGEP